jgi:hypothetical protein
MKYKSMVLATISLITIIGLANLTNAESLQLPYVQKGACPFEGCTYGIWDTLKDTYIYKKPDKNSGQIGQIPRGEKLRAVTGDVYVIPGRAKVIDRPHRSARNLNTEKEIFILDYVGEGYSRIFQDGIYAEVKIARTKNRCKENPNWRYCWVEVIEEPVTYWWVFVESLDGKIKGWVLMEGGVLKAIDAFS